MLHSEQIETLMAALIKAQAEFPLIPKTKEVVVQTQKGAYAFKYAPLEEMVKLLRPILTKHGIGFTQGTDGDILQTVVFHASGQWIEFRMPLPDKPYAQEYGSQLTYRRRYALKAALGVETDEDDADNQYTDDGKKKKITPMAGIMDEVRAERKEAVQRLVYGIVDYMNNDQPQEAYESFRSIADQWERAAVWSMLDRKMKRAIKDLAAVDKSRPEKAQEPHKEPQ